MTNIYILSKSYLDFMFVFLQSFYRRAKRNNIKMCLLCIHALSLTHTHTHTLTLKTEHEYSTQ